MLSAGCVVCCGRAGRGLLWAACCTKMRQGQKGEESGKRFMRMSSTCRACACKFPAPTPKLYWSAAPSGSSPASPAAAAAGAAGAEAALQVACTTVAWTMLLVVR